LGTPTIILQLPSQPAFSFQAFFFFWNSLPFNSYMPRSPRLFSQKISCPFPQFVSFTPPIVLLLTQTPAIHCFSISAASSVVYDLHFFSFPLFVDSPCPFAHPLPLDVSPGSLCFFPSASMDSCLGFFLVARGCYSPLF